MTRTLSDRESSVLFSLRELRSIEADRVEDEAFAARETAAAAERVRLAQEARVRDAAAARARADEAAAKHAREVIALRVREEELRVKEAEARARADHAAAIEELRLAEEMAVRRLAAAKQRPTWLVAGVAISVVATAIAIFIAVDRNAQKSRADAIANAAEQQRIAAVDKARSAHAGLAAATLALEEINGQLRSLDGEIASIEREIANANTAAKRAVAAASADELRRRQRVLKEEAERRARIIKPRCPPDQPLC